MRGLRHVGGDRAEDRVGGALRGARMSGMRMDPGAVRHAAGGFEAAGERMREAFRAPTGVYPESGDFGPVGAVFVPLLTEVMQRIVTSALGHGNTLLEVGGRLRATAALHEDADGASAGDLARTEGAVIREPFR